MALGIPDRGEDIKHSPHPSLLRGISCIVCKSALNSLINPRRACAARVTVVVSCVCLYVCPHTLFWQYVRLKV